MNVFQIMTFSIMLLLFSMSSISLFGQTATQSPCSTEANRQFDFWVGNWNVYDKTKKLVGTNEVKSILGDCVIQENWKGTGQSVGQSYNTYDQHTKTWNQVWVDNFGTTLHFSGVYEDKQMKMKGESVNKKGEKIYHQLTFFNNNDGTVRQLWKSSKDKSKWTVSFDGLYVRKEGN